MYANDITKLELAKEQQKAKPAYIIE
jgi:hypothetical protein